MDDHDDSILDVDYTATTFSSYILLIIYAISCSAITLWPLFTISHISLKENYITILIIQIIVSLLLFVGHINSKCIYKQRSAFYRQNYAPKESKKLSNKYKIVDLIAHISEQESTYLSLLNNISIFLIIQQFLAYIVLGKLNTMTSYFISMMVSSLIVFFISKLNI